MSDRLDMALRNDIAEIGRVLDAAEACGEEHGIPDSLLFRLTVGIGGGRLDVEPADNRAAFNPVEAELRESGGSLEERRIGGLGPKSVRRVADSLDYRRDGAFNRLQPQRDIDGAKRGAGGTPGR